jgi:hypothetical protein
MRSRGQRKAPPLDPAVVAELVRAYTEEGRGTEELALMFRIAGKRVCAALREAGVELRRYGLNTAADLSAQDEAEIARLYESGATLHELKARFRCSTERVRAAVVAHGIQVRSMIAPTAR